MSWLRISPCPLFTQLLPHTKRTSGTLLCRRLTKEELERRSKESMLSEVGGKALEAEEQVKVLRQRINEMEEQMKKTEEVYKDQVWPDAVLGKGKGTQGGEV